MKEKPLIVLDRSSTGKGGGPYTSTARIIDSPLKEKYNFQTFVYRTELGRFISIRRILDIRRQLTTLRPDIVHFTGLQLAGFHIAVACKLAGLKRTVVTIRGFSGDALNISKLKKVILSYCLEPLTLALTKRNYGVSEYVASRRMVRIFKRKSLGYIYNFPPEPSLDCNKPSLRKELGIDNDDIVVVSVARIIKDKGYHILEMAINSLKNKPNIKFVIVGSGDYLRDMRVNLNDCCQKGKIFFLGHREDVQEILRSSDIFVLPTLHETLSVALLEASVEGLAIIASRTGGIPEIIIDQYNGVLVAPGSVEELTNAIDKLSGDQAQIRYLGRNARKIIEKKFDRHEIVEKIDAVYQNLIKI